MISQYMSRKSHFILVAFDSHYISFCDKRNGSATSPNYSTWLRCGEPWLLNCLVILFSIEHNVVPFHAYMEKLCGGKYITLPSSSSSSSSSSLSLGSTHSSIVYYTFSQTYIDYFRMASRGNMNGVTT